MKPTQLTIPKTKKEAYRTMRSVMNGEYGTEEVIRFLTLFQAESTSENVFLGFLDGVRDSAVYLIDASHFSKFLVDIVGTGGDGKCTANISTLAALMCAATDLVYVAKYGNRSASGLCGSMDVLEGLGIDIELSQQQTYQQLKATDFVPLYARAIYPGAKFVAEARKQIGKPTIFNLLLPLARPVKGQLRYVFGFAKDQDMKIAQKILTNDPNTRCLLVRGLDGTDEISITASGQTKYVLIDHGKATNGVLDCQKIFSIHPVDLSLLQITLKSQAIKVFEQAIQPDPYDEKIRAIQNAALVNAAVALFIALDRKKDLDISQKYLVLVEQALRSGAVLQLVNRLRLKSNRVSVGLQRSIYG